MAVTYIDNILEKNATEEAIEEAVRKVCSFLPESMRDEVSEGAAAAEFSFAARFLFTQRSLRSQCDQLVTEYEPTLIQLLLQMLDPDFVCTVSAEANSGSTCASCCLGRRELRFTGLFFFTSSLCPL